MKLTKFRIQDYRSIQDSGWVDIDNIAVIVGKNESGKTSLLKALWKLNPFHDADYNTDFWILSALSTLFKDAGKVGLDDQLVITPAGGASKVAYIGTILNAQNLNVAVMLV